MTMLRQKSAPLVVALALVLGAAASPLVATFPPNFAVTPVNAIWDQATGVTFAPDGRMFVWEKAGRVWNVEGGVKAATPLIDISEEVGNWRDHGLLGFAIDPDFYHNGHIYLLYVVDYHHLRYFGTPDYNPATSTDFHDTIGRLTRYTCLSINGYRTVNPSSRLILLGENMSTGIPICHQSHGVGTLAFGTDGTLLVSCGDGASYETVDAGGIQNGSSNTALADGIITPAMDVGAFRSQLVNCLSGKILRLDPATGDGVPSNPFYDPGQPRAPQSRVWAMGLRNPFRFCVRPESGSNSPAAGRPGVLYIGDVGWNEREEIDVCTGAGQNFGWPLFEGLTPTSFYPSTFTDNRDAPNPLAGTTPAGQGLCTQNFFRFQDLLIQDTLLANPSFPNPCDPAQQVPANVPHFIHRRPAVDWYHSTGPSRIGTFTGTTASVANIGGSGSAVAGPQFGGRCSIAGCWYRGTLFPAAYQDRLISGDFDNGWMRLFSFDQNDQLASVGNFASNGTGATVCMTPHPTDGTVYFVNYDAAGNSVVNQLSYVDNAPPIALPIVTPAGGPAPLTVQLDGTGSTDPEHQTLTYYWDFGDGFTPARTSSASHTFRMLDDITAQGTIVARLFGMSPPIPLGGGNPDPEVIRDGDFPPVGSSDSLRQFDTYHQGDQNNSDWIGYTFATARTVSALLFQEGRQFADGGWWDSVTVQIRIGFTWQNASGVSISPVYGANNGISFESYLFTFNPVSATGVRISGNPGGSSNFISVGELRVFSPASNPAAPRCYTGSLTVTDSLNSSSTTPFTVSLNNTAPLVQITSPVDGTILPPNQSTTVPLTAIISDAESPANLLTCRWQTILHHNEHVHPEPFDYDCTSSTELSSGGHGLGVLYYEVQLRVEDPACLSTTQSVFLYPSPLGDLDCDGATDDLDIEPFVQALLDPDGYATAFPTCHAANADVNQDSRVDAADIPGFISILLGK